MRGDTIRADGIEYTVIWNGARTDPSLLGEFTGGSTLSPFTEGPKPRGATLRGVRQGQQARTLDRAREEVRRLGR